MKRALLLPRGVAAAFVGTMLWLATPIDLQAQVPGAPGEPVPPEIVAPERSDPGAAQIEESKLDQFADAYIAVEEIHTRTRRELESVRDPEQASQLKASAEGKIIEAVERSGLQLEEFNRIAELMTSDRELRIRIADKVRERRRI